MDRTPEESQSATGKSNAKSQTEGGVSLAGNALTEDGELIDASVSSASGESYYEAVKSPIGEKVEELGVTECFFAEEVEMNVPLADSQTDSIQEQYDISSALRQVSSVEEVQVDEGYDHRQASSRSLPVQNQLEAEAKLKLQEQEAEATVQRMRDLRIRILQLTAQDPFSPGPRLCPTADIEADIDSGMKNADQISPSPASLESALVNRAKSTTDELSLTSIPEISNQDSSGLLERGGDVDSTTSAHCVEVIDTHAEIDSDDEYD